MSSKLNGDERHTELEAFGSILIWEYSTPLPDKLRHDMNVYYFDEFVQHILYDNCPKQDWYKENVIVHTVPELQDAALSWDKNRGPE